MKRRTRQLLPKMIIAGFASVACLGGIGYLGYSTMGQKVADAYGCFSESYSQQQVAIIDASQPRWNRTQQRSLSTYYAKAFDNLRVNEKLSVYTTDDDQLASVVSADFHVCGQARTASEFEELSGSPAESGYLARQKERLFENHFGPRIEQVLDEGVQSHESPILEMLKSTLRDARLEPGDKLVLQSDLIQNSRDSARFCTTQNHMPLFKIFSERSIYRERLVPPSMNGVDVEILMLQREGYAQYCRDEEEIKSFWRDYFIANGAGSVEFIRIRVSAG